MDRLNQKFVIHFLERGKYLKAFMCKRYTEFLNGNDIEVEEPSIEFCDDIQTTKLFDSFIEAKEWAKKSSEIDKDAIAVELVSIIDGIVTYEFQWWSNQYE